MTRKTTPRAVIAALLAAAPLAAFAGPLSTATPSSAMVPQVATTTWSGTIVLKINITIKSGIPADMPLSCDTGVNVEDASGLSYGNDKSVLATRSGNTATCSIGIYYAWPLSETSPTFSQSYIVGGSGTGSLRLIFASGNLADAAVPINGTSISRTINVTI